MNFGQLHHIEYYVLDLEKAKLFWGWFLPEFGYREYQKWNSGISWLHDNGTYIVFCQVADDKKAIRNDRQGNGLNHIAIVGKDPEHLKHIKSELDKRSIRIHASRPNSIWFEDWNGLAVEIYAAELET